MEDGRIEGRERNRKVKETALAYLDYGIRFGIVYQTGRLKPWNMSTESPSRHSRGMSQDSTESKREKLDYEKSYAGIRKYVPSAISLVAKVSFQRPCFACRTVGIHKFIKTVKLTTSAICEATWSGGILL